MRAAGEDLGERLGYLDKSVTSSSRDSSAKMENFAAKLQAADLCGQLSQSCPKRRLARSHGGLGFAAHRPYRPKATGIQPPALRTDRLRSGTKIFDIPRFARPASRLNYAISFSLSILDNQPGIQTRIERLPSAQIWSFLMQSLNASIGYRFCLRESGN